MSAKVAVIYDVGAADPLEIVDAAGDAVEVVFVAAPSPHARALLPVLQGLATTLALSDPALHERLRADGVEGVTTFSERQLTPTAHVATALDLPHNTPAACARLGDKFLQRTALTEHGLDHAVAVSVGPGDELRAVVAQVGLPCVLKPRRGSGSRGVRLLESTADVDAAQQELRGLEEAFVVEEYLSGRGGTGLADYLSVETLAVDGTYQHYGVTGKLPYAPPFREIGQFLPSDAEEASATSAVRTTDRALRALGVTQGLIHTELKLTADGPQIIEVNGRLGGWMHELYQRGTGLNLIRTALEVSAGRQVTLRPERTAGIAFQFSNLAPPDAVELLRPAQHQQVTAVAGVTTYRRLIRTGATITVGSASCELDLVCGRAASLSAMREVLREVAEAAVFELRFSDGHARRVAGSELPSATWLL